MTALLLVLAISGGLFFGVLVFYSGFAEMPFITGLNREGEALADTFRRYA